MDISKGNGKSRKGNNLIFKTWERCKSIGRGTKKTPEILMEKSKSWPRIQYLRQPENHDHDHDLDIKQSRKRQVAPEGCFSVYVGPEKQRFVVKMEYVNHPLFKILLEEAESEYGYNPEGPLALPCNVEIFYEFLVAMENTHEISHKRGFCGFSKSFTSPYHHLVSSSSLVN